MKKITHSFICLLLGASLFSCVKEKLILPPESDKTETGTIDLIAKPTDIKFVGEYDYGFTIKWPKVSNKVTKIVIDYVDKGEDQSLEFTDFSEDTYLELAEYKEYTFSATAYSGEDLVSSTAYISAKNRDLYINEVIASRQVYVDGSDVVVEWNNPLSRSLDFDIIYPTTDGNKTVAMSSNSDQDKIRASGEFGEQMTFVIHDSLDNTSTYTIKYGMVGSQTIDDAEKENWSVAVSSNQEGDGGGAPALIDGDVQTFWHTPWSGEIPPWPHYATITLDTERDLNGFAIALRHNNGTAAPKDIDFQISEDGVNFVTVQSFVNTSTENGAKVSYRLDNTVNTKYVRLSLASGFNGGHTNLGEIYLAKPILGIVK